MTLQIVCPSCRHPLRVPDRLQGKDVRCPSCQHTFVAQTEQPPAPPAPPPVPVPPSLSLDDPLNPPATAPPAAPPGPRGLSGAVELNLSLDDDRPPAPANPAPLPDLEPIPAHPPERTDEPEPSPSWRDHEDEAERDREEEDLLTCRQCGRQVHPDAARCYHCGYPLAFDQRGARLPRSREAWREIDLRKDGEQTQPWRRDAEPHRGPLILTLGIIGLVCLGFCGPIGVVLGVIAWVLGHQDLEKIKKRQLDPEGEGLTQAGWVCGISGTILNFLWILACLGFFWLVYLERQNQAIATRPKFGAPAPAPMGPWDGNGWKK
jgi:predicted Zn finger-like uncharacterized protein